MTTRNLGLVKAIYVGNSPPSNTDLLWRDTSLTTPLHKFYNTSTSSWEAFIYSVLIDNVTIKKDVDDKLYVDTSEISSLVIADGSITLQKLADVATSSVFYRKTAGDGPPETQSLATLKADLGLTGTNSGDQDLTPYVLKITEINGKALTGNITLTPADIGSPSGSGTSTGTNTGDEDEASILSKLGIVSISGINTGDQDAADVSVEDTEGLFSADNVEDVLAEVKAIADGNKDRVISITLPSATTIVGRIAGATEGVDYPTGWVLTPGSSPVDLDIEHNLGKRVADVTVFANISGTIQQKLFDTAAYNGIITDDENNLRIQSLATVQKIIIINIIFA